MLKFIMGEYCSPIFTVLKTCEGHMFMYLRNDSVGGEGKDLHKLIIPTLNKSFNVMQWRDVHRVSLKHYLILRWVDSPKSCMCVTFSHGASIGTFV